MYTWLWRGRNNKFVMKTLQRRESHAVVVIRKAALKKQRPYEVH